MAYNYLTESPHRGGSMCYIKKQHTKMICLDRILLLYGPSLFNAAFFCDWRSWVSESDFRLITSQAVLFSEGHFVSISHILKQYLLFRIVMKLKKMCQIKCLVDIPKSINITSMSFQCITLIFLLCSNCVL